MSYFIVLNVLIIRKIYIVLCRMSLVFMNYVIFSIFIRYFSPIISLRFTIRKVTNRKPQSNFLM